MDGVQAEGRYLEQAGLAKNVDTIILDRMTKRTCALDGWEHKLLKQVVSTWIEEYTKMAKTAKQQMLLMTNAGTSTQHQEYQSEIFNDGVYISTVEELIALPSIRNKKRIRDAFSAYEDQVTEWLQKELTKHIVSAEELFSWPQARDRVRQLLCGDNKYQSINLRQNLYVIHDAFVQAYSTHALAWFSSKCNDFVTDHPEYEERVLLKGDFENQSALTAHVFIHNQTIFALMRDFKYEYNREGLDMKEFNARFYESLGDYCHQKGYRVDNIETWLTANEKALDTHSPPEEICMVYMQQAKLDSVRHFIDTRRLISTISEWLAYQNTPKRRKSNSDGGTKKKSGRKSRTLNA